MTVTQVSPSVADAVNSQSVVLGTMLILCLVLLLIFKEILTTASANMNLTRLSRALRLIVTPLALALLFTMAAQFIRAGVV